jgi:hypothetical protein
MTFRDWIKEQRHRNDAAGYLSNWFQHPKRGLLPATEPKDFAAWKKIISTKSSVQTKEGLLCSLKTSWDEWNSIDAKTSGQKEVITVRSTISRLKKIVKGHHENGKDGKEEVISVEKFQSPVSYVSVSNKMTRNLGNYESLTIEFSIGVPCYPEEIKDALDFAEGIVSERLESEFKKSIGVPTLEDVATKKTERRPLPPGVETERIKRPEEMIKTEKAEGEKSEEDLFESDEEDEEFDVEKPGTETDFSEDKDPGKDVEEDDEFSL